jgi:hypothetical protein
VPEFIGYQRGIPDWLIYTFIVVYVVILTLSGAALYYLYRVMRPGTYVQVPLTPEQEQLVATRSTDSSGWFRILAATWTLMVIAIGIVFLMISVYWPSPPEVSMCNAQVMWTDTMNMIINTVTSGKASVESEVLLTVYNPNRLGIELNSVSGNILYKGADVGSVSLGNIDAAPGSAADGLGVVKFDGFDRITEMYYDFNIKHDLWLEFELFVNFSVNGLGGIGLAIPKLQLNVNNPPPQKHCKCVNGTDLHFQSTASILDFEVI